MIFVRSRKNDIRWKTALIYSVIAGVLMILMRLNELPLQMYGFDTKDSFSSFVTQVILIHCILIPLGIGVWGFLGSLGIDMWNLLFPLGDYLRNLAVPFELMFKTYCFLWNLWTEHSVLLSNLCMEFPGSIGNLCAKLCFPRKLSIYHGSLHTKAAAPAKTRK